MALIILALEWGGSINFSKKAGRLILLALIIVLANTVSFANSQKGIKKIFPLCEIEKKTHYMSSDNDEDIKRSLGQEKRIGSIFHYFLKKCSNSLTHLYVLGGVIRTMPHYILFEYDKSSLIKVVLLDFREPVEYKLPQKWFDQFLGDRVQKIMEKDVDGISGATLTTKSTMYFFRLGFSLNKIIQNEKK